MSTGAFVFGRFGYPYWTFVETLKLELRVSRRLVLKALAGAVFVPLLSAAGTAAVTTKPRGILVTDVHSRLIICSVSKVVRVPSVSAAKAQLAAVRRSRDGHLAICGARHAGGAQQFATDAPLMDMTSLDRVLQVDEKRGLIRVESGIRWPALIGHLRKCGSAWTFRQKQTGSDQLTIGGALSANAHGQGLKFKPMIGDVQQFDLLMADGKLRTCSRDCNSDLFKLVIGGYGNFGLITSATMRLTKRLKYRRMVEPCMVSEVPARYAQCVANGAIYGDFQADIDEKSGADFLSKGVFSCYVPVSDDTPITELPSAQPDQWLGLVGLAHTDKANAYDVFSKRILSTNGAVNWPEYWQSSIYVDDYHRMVNEKLGLKEASTEILTETYVPLASLPAFVESVRQDFLANKVNVAYSTIRFIEKDDESFLPWARAMSACVIYNLHTEHTPEAQKFTADACRRLIDHAIKYNGSYYLTYHRYANRDQVLACYPEFPEFLKLKRQYDPKRVFRSDWYSHYERMFS